MPSLVAAFLVKDEGAEDRYFRRALENANRWCDTVVVLDDQSEDNTVLVAHEYRAHVVSRETNVPAWGHEAPARKALWDLAVRVAEPTQAWVLFQDADMLLSEDPRPLLQSEAVNTWCWVLRDLWDSPETYRADGPWKGHTVPRPWLVNPFRVPEGWEATWPDRGIHCGHLPSNWPMGAGIAPDSYYWEHYSFMKREHREKKHAAYLSTRHLMTEAEVAHAQSILDDS